MGVGFDEIGCGDLKGSNMEIDGIDRGGQESVR
jgi:hypothetical protein